MSIFMSSFINGYIFSNHFGDNTALWLSGLLIFKLVNSWYAELALYIYVYVYEVAFRNIMKDLHYKKTVLYFKFNESKIYVKQNFLFKVNKPSNTCDTHKLNR